MVLYIRNQLCAYMNAARMMNGIQYRNLHFHDLTMNTCMQGKTTNVISQTTSMTSEMSTDYTAQSAYVGDITPGGLHVCTHAHSTKHICMYVHTYVYM